jgi:hypothetical protein
MKQLLAGLGLLLLAGCSSMSGLFGDTGFREEMLTANRYRVTYTASEGTKASLIGDRTLARAAQVTLDKGQEWFEVDSRIDIENGQTLVIVMGSGETLAGGVARHYDAKQTLDRLKDRIG